MVRVLALPAGNHFAANSVPSAPGNWTLIVFGFAAALAIAAIAVFNCADGPEDKPRREKNKHRRRRSGGAADSGGHGGDVPDVAGGEDGGGNVPVVPDVDDKDDGCGGNQPSDNPPGDAPGQHHSHHGHGANHGGGHGQHHQHHGHGADHGGGHHFSGDGHGHAAGSDFSGGGMGGGF